jgi:ATP-dependent RNA helicase DeaD
MEKDFKQLGLSSDFLKVIEEKGFKEPTEIQEKAIPLALKGKDIIGCSATGSGKTLAFVVNILDKVKKGQGIQALILTPTRELAKQVSEAFKIFSKYKSLKITEIYGGVSITPQYDALKKAEIVIGTPGRILDHISRKTINLSKVKHLVLDEADRMLDMGFLPDVKKIIQKLPKKRQTFLFSATISYDILDISKRYMHNPIEISVKSRVDPSKLKQVFYDVDSKGKFSLLVHLLKQEKSHLVMVFSNTKRNVDFLGRNLRKQGINAVALHGDLSQNKRSNILNKFNKSEKLVLVCTDVAARGLDIKNVSHVYNYDCPKTLKDYVHRVGRTARAGKHGKAITIISSSDYESFQKIEGDISINVKREKVPKFKFIRAFKKPRKHKSKRFNKHGNNRRRNFHKKRHNHKKKSRHSRRRFSHR